MKICNLKIETEFYDLITSGEKIYEVRKLEKKYISKNDIIHFVDPNKNHLGYASVEEVYIGSRTEVLKALECTADISSREFVKTHYSDEKTLVMFKLSPLKEVKIADKLIE